ncbi:MAG: J domain-containing protein [Chloroflexia bacterium]|nr:J domain-containing protein [Chloroflexia bacterium]
MAARPNQRSAPGPGPAANRTQDNLYELLSVPYTASPAEITKSYREAMKRFHPDRVRPEHRQAAEDLSKDLNRAYRTLSNPTERLAYDRSIRAQVVQDQVFRRYTGEFGGPRAGRPDLHATHLKRELTDAERRDHRRGERSAFVSLFSVFLVVTLGGIGLILVGGLLSFLFQQLFS